jgi:hypothetical protein
VGLVRTDVLGSLGACALACGFDASGIGSSGDLADTSSASGMATLEHGGDDAMDASGIDDGALDTNDDAPGTEGGPTEGSGADETVGGNICGDWWNPAWTRRREVILGDTGVEAALMDVPVLVLLEPRDIDYAATQIGGTDLRFVDSAGQVLDHEIESWTPDDASFVWLRVPVLSPMDQPQPRIEMYYGNASAADEKTPQDAWEPGFVSVHHMSSWLDATANGHHGESATPPSAGEGWIAGGGGFDGYDDYLKLVGESSYDLADAVTIEAWIRVANFDSWYDAIVTKGDDAWRLHREGYTDFVGFGTDTATTDNDNLAGMISVNDGQWHYVVAVFGGGEKRLYVDGVPDTSVAYVGPLKLSDHDVLFGENQQSMYRFFEGDMDEVRISSVARGRPWIHVQTLSMNNELLDYGSEETCP